MPIALFGGMEIDAAADTLPAPLTRKARLVLAMLCIEERGLTRASLAEWIWPDRCEEQARSSLRQALSAVRKGLGHVLPDHVIESESDRLVLAGSPEPVDTRHFNRLVDANDVAKLCAGAALYRGDLLEGVEMPEALRDMVMPMRAQYRQTALSLVERLSASPDLPEEGRHRCEALANRLIATDPAAEEAHRAIIRLKLDAGQVNSARKQLEMCVRAVRRELNADPERATLDLIDHHAVNKDDGATAVAAEAAASDNAAPAGDGRPSLAVMPFDDLGRPENDFFADGVVEEITAALSRIRDFMVIARQSAFVYKDQFVDPRRVGAELGVRYLVEGTVRRGEDRLRITVQLIDAQTGVQLWSDRFDGEKAEQFALQDKIASRVAGAISPSIRVSEIQHARQKPPNDLRAYDLVLRAFPHFWSHRREENHKALELFSEAVRRDPEYDVALAYKAWCHAQNACYLWCEDPGEEREKAHEATQMALRRVTDHAGALTAIGAAITITSTDYKLAKSLIDRSLEIDPNNAWAWMRAGWLEVLFGQPDQGIEMLEHAHKLSPHDPFTFNIYFGMADAHNKKGEYATAAEYVERGLRHGAGVTWAYRMLAVFYRRAGETERASAALAKFIENYPQVTVKMMRDGMPPSIQNIDPGYFDQLREAGVPES